MILIIVIEQGFQIDCPRPLPEESDTGLDFVSTHPTVSIPPSTQYPALHSSDTEIISDFKAAQYQICPVETCGVPGVNPELSIWLSLLQVLKMKQRAEDCGNFISDVAEH